MQIQQDAPFSVSRAHASQPLAMQMASRLAGLSLESFAPAVLEKVKTCLFDFFGCAVESIDKPWSRQSLATVFPVSPSQPGSVALIGNNQYASPNDAAFVHAVMGHGLVREDMHSASISHLGVAVLPAVLALAQSRRISGREVMLASIAGYEVGARIGGALMDAKIARIFRPTGTCGPIGAAAASARLLGLDAAGISNAISIAANTPVGFNQWAHTGGSEMYFHVGYTARNGVTAALLAQAGAFASPDALEGEAGLFAAHGKRAAAGAVRIFDGEPEIMAVYHKPVPACNFAQTPCQAALTLARGGRCPIERIRGIQIQVSAAGAAYPGCDFTGPFEHALQAKMSIQFNVAAALLNAKVSESNFEHLNDPRLARLMAMTSLEVDDAMTRAYPSLQGGAVALVLDDGSRHQERLGNVVNASAQEVRARFREAITARLGGAAAARLESMIERLETLPDAGELLACLSLQPSSDGRAQ